MAEALNGLLAGKEQCCGRRNDYQAKALVADCYLVALHP